jgi:hypothetical protein
VDRYKERQILSEDAHEHPLQGLDPTVQHRLIAAGARDQLRAAINVLPPERRHDRIKAGLGSILPKPPNPRGSR